MILVDAETAARLLDFPSLIEALREGHRVGVDDFGRLLMEHPSAAGGHNGLLAMAAWQRGAAFGVKLATVFPSNAAVGLPNIASVYVLFDGQNGRPLLTIDATPLTVRKTAADSALAADYLARPDARTLLVVGAGAQAPWMVAAHRSVRPTLARVLVWNRTHAKAVALAATLHGEAVKDLSAAVAESDIITCVTPAAEPIIHGAWLRPGTHLDLVGGYTPLMRESDDDAVRRSRVFVDTRRFTLHDAGDIAQPLRDGVIGETDVLADLFQLVRGEVPGRRDASEITLFKNAGGGHLDLMAARLIAARLG
jgi:ornithine cyclodeaminase/alanine dehydrogenase-like protein (mu-crystallin family)